MGVWFYGEKNRAAASSWVNDFRYFKTRDSLPHSLRNPSKKVLGLRTDVESNYSFFLAEKGYFFNAALYQICQKESGKVEKNREGGGKRAEFDLLTQDFPLIKIQAGCC